MDFKLGHYPAACYVGDLSTDARLPTLRHDKIAPIAIEAN